MTLDKLYNILEKTSFKSLDKQMVEMLRDTWAKLASEVKLVKGLTCRKCTVDEVRIAVYSNINIWESKRHAKVLNEWMDLTYEKQNELLIVAFPDGRKY